MEREELEQIGELGVDFLRGIIPQEGVTDIFLIITSRLGDGMNRTGTQISVENTEDPDEATARAIDVLFSTLEALLATQNRQLQVFEMPSPPGQG